MALRGSGRAFGGPRGCRWRAARRTVATAVTAAVLGQIAYQPVHHGEVGRVDELAALAALRNQPRALKILKVKRQGRGHKTDTLADRACRQSLGAALDQQSIDREPVLVCEGTECPDDRGSFHVSMILRVSSYRQLNDLTLPRLASMRCKVVFKCQPCLLRLGTRFIGRPIKSGIFVFARRP